MAQQQTTALPATHRALRQDERYQPLTVQKIAVPTVIPSSVLLRVLAADINNYSKQIFNGERQYQYPVPITPGSSAIGRVAEVGQDAIDLKVGDLCFVDISIRGRESDRVQYLQGVNAGITRDHYLKSISAGITPTSYKLMSNAGFKDGTYAEYVLSPVESVYRLDERKLLGSPDQGGFGYKLADLLYINRMVVPYGGLSPLCINVKPGETVIVAPATGAFGSAAVHLSLELGAGKVIAMGRNTSLLEKIKSLEPSDKRERIVIAPLTGILEKDLEALNEAKGEGEIDALFDISPPMAQGSAHINAAVQVLKNGGRVCLMGGLLGDVALSHISIMLKDITIKGKLMYERQDVRNLIKLVENGLVRLYKEENGWKMHRSHCVKEFALEDWEAAFDAAEKLSEEGNYAFVP